MVTTAGYLFDVLKGAFALIILIIMFYGMFSLIDKAYHKLKDLFKKKKGGIEDGVPEPAREATN